MKQQILRLAKSALIYGVGDGLGRLIGFLLLPLFTAYLTPTDYGVISLLGVIALIVAPVASFGLTAAAGVCYFEGNNRERKETTIWTMFAILMISVSFITLLGVIFARQISILAFQVSDYYDLVALSLLSTGMNILVLPFALYLQFEERAKAFAVLMGVSLLLSVCLEIFMVVVLTRGVRGVVEAQLIARIISFVLFLMIIGFGIRIRVSLSLGYELLRLGFPLVPSFGFLFILQHGNKYILQWSDGLEAAGIYTIGFNFGLAMLLAVSAFSKAWMPYFMSFVDKQSEAPVLFSHIMTYYVLGMGSLSLLFYIVAKPAVMILTQPTFHQAYIVVGLSATAQFLIGIFYILLPGIYFAKEIKYVSLIQGGAALITIGSNLLLIPFWGLLGAGIALVLGVLTMVLLQHIWNLRHKSEYIHVPYEWNRLSGFAGIYSVYVVFTLWERDFSLMTEIVFSVTATFLLVSLIYALLNERERQIFWAVTKQLVLRLSRPSLLRA